MWWPTSWLVCRAGIVGKYWAPKILLKRLNRSIFCPPHWDIFCMAMHWRDDQHPEGQQRIKRWYSEEWACVEKWKIAIPSDAHDLQRRLLVVSHEGAMVHRGGNTTLEYLQETFYWYSMEEYCREFLRRCIYCLMYSVSHFFDRRKDSSSARTFKLRRRTKLSISTSCLLVRLFRIQTALKDGVSGSVV